MFNGSNDKMSFAISKYIDKSGECSSKKSSRTDGERHERQKLRLLSLDLSFEPIKYDH